MAFFNKKAEKLIKLIKLVDLIKLDDPELSHYAQTQSTNQLIQPFTQSFSVVCQPNIGYMPH